VGDYTSAYQHPKNLFAAPIRILGAISAILFIVTIAGILAEPMQPTLTLLPSFASRLLVATLVACIWMIRRER
jgi:hypothetical protein